MKMVMSDRPPIGLRFWYSRVAHLHVQHKSQCSFTKWQIVVFKCPVRLSVRPYVHTFHAIACHIHSVLGAEHTTVHRPVHSEISDVLERIRSLDGIFRTIFYVPDILKKELRGPLNPQRHNRFANESL